MKMKPVFSMRHEYDSWNRMQEIVYPDGETVSYHYDRGGQLRGVESDKNGNGMTYIQSISYNKFGQRANITYGNGSHSTYSYDLQQRLTGLRSFTGNNETMQDISYNFDPVGNITDVYNYAGVLQNGLGGQYDYRHDYDALYRLVGSYGNGVNGTHYGMTVDYTPNGKVVEKHSVGMGELNGVASVPIATGYSYSYPAGSNRLKEVYEHVSSTRRYFTWDGSGNMLLNDKGRAQQRHCWDEENRLMLMRSGRETAHYTYDANGERVYKITGYNYRMNINGRNQDDHAVLHDPTLYASPYVVATPKGYTKHYYAGDERIVSRIGGGG
ncbi:hypothetical protein LJC37_05045, partial [Bacteroidales bacterium OttesenSCG-928-E04]|nr:hypothetical protein [Bacteroidales bacterium OttesenSCG-928-E04]